MKNILAKPFIAYLDSINFEDKSVIEVLKTKDKQFGDYTSNVSLRLTKALGKNPMEIAEEIKTYIETNFNDDFNQVTVTNPGFVNLFLSEKFVVNNALKFVDENYKPSFNQINNININYEYVSANPTGHLHIGHARNAVVGDVTVNILKYLGHNVRTEYWINDAGVQMRNLAESTYYYYAEAANIPLENLTEEDVSYKGEEIKAYGKELADQGYEAQGETQEDRINNMINLCGKYFLDEIVNLLKNEMKIQEFDNWQSEKWTLENKFGPVFDELKQKGFVYENEGATWVKTSEYGDEKDRVLIKSDGTYTYMAADVAYHIIKHDHGNIDLMIDLWGKDHHGYEPRMQAALEAVGITKGSLEVDYISMVKVMKDGEELKMSKRAGTSLTIKDILSEMDAESFRYFLISKSKEQDMKIDIDIATAEDMNNPLYYVQYANARANQIIEKYKAEIGEINILNSFDKLGTEEKEKDLMVKMNEFEDTLVSINTEREPSLLINYWKELAQSFNSFYSSVKVITDDKELSEQRVNLILAVKNQFRTIFNLVGIEPVDKI